MKIQHCIAHKRKESSLVMIHAWLVKGSQPFGLRVNYTIVPTQFSTQCHFASKPFSNGYIHTERRTLTECIFKGMTMRFLHRHIRSELHKPVIPKRMCTVCLGCNAVTTSYHKGKDQCSNFCISHKINIISLFRLQNYNFFSYLPNISLFF